MDEATIARKGRSVEAALGPRLIEALFACAAVLVLCVVVLAAPATQASGAAFVAAVGFGVLALVGAWIPRTALAATILGIFAYYAAGFPPLGMVLPAIGALYLTASRRRAIWAIGGAVILLAVATYFRLADSDPSARFTGYEYVTEITLAAASIALGVAVRSAREQRRQAVRIAELVAAEQRHETEREVQDERLRIARELHDTVGHQLTVGALHASVAAESLEKDPVAVEAAREAVARVRDANTESLRELRSAVRLLRDAAGGSDPLAIAELTRTAREAGLEVSLDIDDDLDPAGVGPAGPAGPAGLDPAIAGAAQGILREAVTNVLRHASAGSLRLTVVRDVEGRGAELLRIEIADDGVGTGAELHSSGSGIAGMRERAVLVGGLLEFHSTPGEGTTVRALLPLGATAGEHHEGSAS